MQIYNFKNIIKKIGSRLKIDLPTGNYRKHYALDKFLRSA